MLTLARSYLPRARSQAFFDNQAWAARGVLRYECLHSLSELVSMVVIVLPLRQEL